MRLTTVLRANPLDPETSCRGRVTVFAGSAPGSLPVYRDAAQALGRELGIRGLGLIFGGTSGGLMQAVADAVKENGGEVIGVLPAGAWPELHYDCTQRIEVESMAARKLAMIDRADGVLCLPGGPGTFDEIWEVLTEDYLGDQDKPIGILNTSSYFVPFLRELFHMREQGFARSDPRDLLIIEQDPARLVQRLLDDKRWSKPVQPHHEPATMEEGGR